MNAAELHQRVSDLYADAMTGERHAPEITAALSVVVKATRLAAERAACAHVASDPFKETHAAGRDLVTKCVKCGQTLSCEPTL